MRCRNAVSCSVMGNGDDDVIEHNVDVRDVAKQLVVLALKHFRRGRNSKRQTQVRVTSKWSVECTQFRASIIQLNVPKTIAHVNNREHPLAVQFGERR